uniref:Uncharacterized protein n=1 Tax=Mesocestoides corti TaxID=53468 RepID=A0A5K3FEI5_MESCO
MSQLVFDSRNFSPGALFEVPLISSISAFCIGCQKKFRNSILTNHFINASVRVVASQRVSRLHLSKTRPSGLDNAFL